ncbi:hypothetical protein AAG906_014787 [Vitis piasezkii]
MGSHSPAKIPVVDFSKENLNPGSSSWSATCKDVLLALEEFGCFIAVYDKPYHGYVGQHSRLPLHESMGIDNATTLEGIQSFANFMWSAGNDRFCTGAGSFGDQNDFESYGVGKYYDSHLEPMTYLLRNQVKGLEVETKDGEWISLELSPSSFAVIAGDALVAWSNGRLHSPYHKVMISGNEERYSLGLFQFSSGMIQIPKS